MDQGVEVSRAQELVLHQVAGVLVWEEQIIRYAPVIQWFKKVESTSKDPASPGHIHDLGTGTPGHKATTNLSTYLHYNIQFSKSH